MNVVFTFLTIASLFLITSCNSDSTMHSNKQKTSTTIDWQGHRGARGLLPENTIPAFIKALEYPVSTLELDVVVSADSQIIVSHEPWFSAAICSHPNGQPVTEEEQEQLLIYEMSYEQIKQYDCGQRGNEHFPEQQAMPVHKPSFMDMVSNVELHCQKQNISPPHYNIEIKSYPEWYNTRIPEPERFVKLMLEEVNLLNIKKRVNLQSFDLNILRAVYQQDSSVRLAILVDNLEGCAANLKKLDFVPDIYSPHYGLLNASEVECIKSNGMHLIPWTVNDKTTMRRLIQLGVDGIITDYPNYITDL